MDVVGVHELVPPMVTEALRQVSRRKTSLEVFAGVATRLVELDAKATNSPVWLVEGPAVVSVSAGVGPAQVAPQTPRLAWVPSGARSTSKGRPVSSVGFTANVRALDVPPPGAGFTACT